MTIRRIIKNIIGKLIERIERYELRGVSLDENDISKKIIDSHSLDSVYVKSDTGFVKATEIHRTQPYSVYEVKFRSGKVFECADNHILYTPINGGIQEVFVKDIIPGMDICVDYNSNQKDSVVSVTKLPYKLCMYDLSIDSPEHRYYTSGILSHNTTTIAAFISWFMISSIDKNILIASNKLDTVKEILDKIINIFKGLPFFLKPGTEQWGKLAICLDNGCKIVTTATTGTASIGFTIHCVLLDEFAHIPDNIVNNFWRSIYPTLSSSKVSQCIIISTPNGTTNKFYDIWSNSLEGKNSFIHFRTDYWQVPGHDQAWADQMRKDFGEEEFAQEFELQFNKNSKMIMRSEDMAYTERFCKQYVHKDIYVQNQYLQSEYLTWHPDFNPNSIDEDDYFVILVDIAEGNGDPSETFQSKKRTPDANTFNIFRLRINSPANVRRFSNVSCSIKDCVRFMQVGKYSCNSEDEIHMARVCSAVCYNLLGDHLKSNVKVMVEMNFNGKAFFEEFKRHSLYSGSTILKTYHKKPIPGEIQKKKYGFKTTSNKEYYCLRGNKLISRRRTIVTCIETFDQMKSFGYVRGSLKGIACHDDLSMPVFNHIPRMLDESTFVTWIEEYLTNHHDKARVYELNNLIQKWAMDNPDMSDDEFNEIYGLTPAPTFDPNSYIDSPGYIPPAQTSPYTSPYGGNNMAYPGSEMSYPQYPGSMPSPYSENPYPTSPYQQNGGTYADILQLSQNLR